MRRVPWSGGFGVVIQATYGGQRNIEIEPDGPWDGIPVLANRYTKHHESSGYGGDTEKPPIGFKRGCLRQESRPVGRTQER